MLPDDAETGYPFALSGSVGHISGSEPPVCIDGRRAFNRRKEYVE